MLRMLKFLFYFVLAPKLVLSEAIISFRLKFNKMYKTPNDIY